MTTLFDRSKEKLVAKLKNKEYRDAFVSEHIATGIPFQIKALREQREWTQKELGKRSGKHQVIISQLEDPDYGKFTIATLKRLASAFDIGLVVRFVPISELVEWDLNLSSDSLKVLSFNDEPYFKKQEEVAVSMLGANITLPMLQVQGTFTAQAYLQDHNKIVDMLEWTKRKAESSISEKFSYEQPKVIMGGARA